MPRVLVILSGCGVYDGTEIHEAVLTLLHLDRHNATVVMAAPDRNQAHVVNHVTGEPSGETRNVLVESARIARGRVEDLAGIRGDAFDAVILPGGYGAAKNLCDFALNGESCVIDPDVERVLREAHAAGKVIGFLCISPVIAARLLPGVELTIGGDAATAKAITAMGARHVERRAPEVCVDRAHRVVSSPAYMCATRISEVDQSAGRLVEEVLALVAEGSSGRTASAPAGASARS